MAKMRITAEERYAQIVRVAMKLFSQKGFKGTTTREIAQKAGISEATIFKHFAKKDALYSAIIDKQCNDRKGESLLMKKLEGKEGKEVFKEIATFLIQTHQEDPTFLKLLMFSALEGHKLSDIFIRTRGMETLDYLAKKLRSRLTSDELLTLSRIVLIEESDPMLHGVQQAFQAHHTPIEVQDCNLFGLPIQHAYIITSRRNGSESSRIAT